MPSAPPARTSIWRTKPSVCGQSSTELVAAVHRGVTVVLVLPTVANSIDAAAEHHDEPFGDERRALARTPHFTLAGLAGRDATGTRHPVHVHAKLMIIDDVVGDDRLVQSPPLFRGWQQ